MKNTIIRQAQLLGLSPPREKKALRIAATLAILVVIIILGLPGLVLLAAIRLLSQHPKG